MNFDKDILFILSKTTQKKPMELSNIIASFDNKQHLIISYEELYGSLQRLVLSGKVIESKENKYFCSSNKTRKAVNVYNGFTKSFYDDSLAIYLRLANSIIKQIIKK